MIELKIDLKGKPLKNQSIKIAEESIDMVDMLKNGIKNISDSFQLSYIASRPEMMRILIEEAIKNDLNILDIEGTTFSIKDIIKFQIGEFENIEKLTDIIEDRNQLKDFLLKKTLTAINDMQFTINEISVDEIDEDMQKSFEIKRAQANSIYTLEVEAFYGDMKDHRIDRVLRCISEYQELVDNYGLAVDDFEDYLEIEVKNSKVYNILNTLFFYKPSTYAMCKYQLTVIIDLWLKYCMSYSLREVSDSNELSYSFTDFIEEVESKIGEEFIESFAEFEEAVREMN